MNFTSIINKLDKNYDLDKEDLAFLFMGLRNKTFTDIEIQDLITKWRNKGSSVDELVTLVELVKSIDIKENTNKYQDSIDVCGTGGDKLNTINISTLTAIVLSSLGVKVIKHSGRSSTSISGSIDILEQMGINLEKITEDSLVNYNLMFIGSKVFRETFIDVKRVGKKINVSSFVNLLGPLCNPYYTKYHLLGVSNPNWGELLAKALRAININNKALIVTSEVENNIFMDELSFCGESKIWLLENGEIKSETLDFKEFCDSTVSLNDLIINNAEEGKELFEEILKGKNAKLENKIKTIALNVGAGLYLSHKVTKIKDGYETALKQIKSGNTWEHFTRFRNSIS